MLQRAVVSAAVELANEQPFAIGALHVEPAHLRVSRGDATHNIEPRGNATHNIEPRGNATHNIEPRVMQVLVVLGQADGRVISRAELVERCWDGRIVGENAIQRVISQLRSLGKTTAAFEVEAVTKVGYLLRPTGWTTSAEAPIDETPAEPVIAPSSRRAILVGAATVVAAAGGIFALRGLNATDPDAKAAAQLVDKARESLRVGLPDETEQAIAYLKQATAIDPESADAWGTLALAYRQMMDASDGPELEALAAWTKSAAQQALILEPDNRAALFAVAAIPPNFGNLIAKERALLPLASGRPPFAPLEEAIGQLFGDAGRLREATQRFRQAMALDPYDSMYRFKLAWSLWSLGELAEADRLYEDAHRMWPRNRGFWQHRFKFLATTGRFEGARALVQQSGLRPTVAAMQPSPPYDVLERVTLALESRDGAAMAASAAELVTAKASIGIPSVAALLCALGEGNAAFQLLDKHYYAGGEKPLPSRFSRRYTGLLFSAWAGPVRRHPDFPALTRRIGLDAYWKATGTRPDIR